MEFAERVLGCWLETATPGRELFACPEQIAGGYELSTFPDRFTDAREIAAALRKAFKRQLKSWSPPASA